jgi:septum site-determining protein MinC
MAEQLSDTVDQAESFFHNAPVVIDLNAIPDANIEFPMLVGLMRGHGMIPVGVRGGTSAQHEAAEVMGLAVLADGRQSRTAPQSKPTVVPIKPSPTTEILTTLVNRPIRSGQRIYAKGGDLIILGQVSSGAEVMADGHIHVYASLRGRALAGVTGNENARIFCRDLQAELISVAGHYRISENIDTKLRDQPVQIYLEERILRIDTL